ncbi:hypothetical protein GCM10026987_11010 [Belliella aquatica]|uniref:Uncharacterized protein n=1 Tax=Belliella aquatica TaxID=1323734 RepID=A0ABQ1M302_9BACT|nr:hypothetical protein GCM10010993_10910 [Belliella aquatica]
MLDLKKPIISGGSEKIAKRLILLCAKNPQATISVLKNKKITENAKNLCMNKNNKKFTIQIIKINATFVLL